MPRDNLAKPADVTPEQWELRRWEQILGPQRLACSIHLPSGGTFRHSYVEWGLFIPLDTLNVRNWKRISD
jgi:hypothetical protein